MQGAERLLGGIAVAGNDAVVIRCQGQVSHVSTTSQLRLVSLRTARRRASVQLMAEAVVRNNGVYKRGLTPRKGRLRLARLSVIGGRRFATKGMTSSGPSSSLGT